MLDEVQKSIKAILYERTTSPLYGTFAVSWGIWNWKILYYLFWDENEDAFFTKMDCISELASIHSLLTFPLLATLFFLTIGKLVSNGAYWLNLKFEKWKSDQKNIIERQQLISLEKSIELREQIRLQDEKFSELLSSKEEEIKILKSEIELLHNPINKAEKKNEIQLLSNNDELENLLSEKDYNKIKETGLFKENFRSIINKINSNQDRKSYTNELLDLVEFLESNYFIELNEYDRYFFTQKGKELKRRFINEKFN